MSNLNDLPCSVPTMNGSLPQGHVIDDMSDVGINALIPSYDSNIYNAKWYKLCEMNFDLAATLNVPGFASASAKANAYFLNQMNFNLTSVSNPQDGSWPDGITTAYYGFGFAVNISYGSESVTEDLSLEVISENAGEEGNYFSAVVSSLGISAEGKLTRLINDITSVFSVGSFGPEELANYLVAVDLYNNEIATGDFNSEISPILIGVDMEDWLLDQFEYGDTKNFTEGLCAQTYALKKIAEGNSWNHSWDLACDYSHVYIDPNDHDETCESNSTFQAIFADTWKRFVGGQNDPSDNQVKTAQKILEMGGTYDS